MIHLKFPIVHLSRCFLLLESSSHCTRNNDPYEDDFPSRGSQLSKPKETNPRESPIYSPPPSLSPTVVSNPFVGSMPVTPSLFPLFVLFTMQIIHISLLHLPFHRFRFRSFLLLQSFFDPFFSLCHVFLIPFRSLSYATFPAISPAAIHSAFSPFRL